jgi:predicted O-methyltransferase YrrM
LKRLAGFLDPASTEGTRAVAIPETFVPAGHYYSPIPSLDDIQESRRRVRGEFLAGIDLNEAGQVALLNELARYYPSMPFTEEGSAGFRFRFDNPSYSYADGIFLYTMLQHLRPRRVIEVGSGYTSALTLDTSEHFLGDSVETCFIEPHPQLLLSLITEADRQRSRVFQCRLQEVDLALFDTLGANDMLFIDSTHVSKVGSDVNYLFFEILPRLAPGVIVHLHDIFPGFEYPIDWLKQGRAWNEQYVLRAFLEFNASFRIRLFGSHMIQRDPEWFRAHMPLCLKNPGGAFWMERVA